MRGVAFDLTLNHVLRPKSLACRGERVKQAPQLPGARDLRADFPSGLPGVFPIHQHIRLIFRYRFLVNLARVYRRIDADIAEAKVLF